MVPRDVDEIIAGLIRSEEAGESVDREAVIVAHPQHAETLRQFFADRDSVGRLLTPVLPARRMPLPARLRYFGDYELIDEIASGGMGVVYRARQKTLDRIVAVKMIKSGQLASDEDIRRFETEAKAAANLRHANIVSVHEVGVHHGQHYFSMEYVDGQNLAELIRDKPLPARRAARYARDIAAAVHFAHTQGTLHRDLKPSNVLVDADDHVRITDFGLAARIEGNGELTRTGQILGTPSYIAPEQAQGKRGLIGPASDIYSLGVILYELLTGRPPFRAETAVETIRQVVELEPVPARRLNPTVPRELETICAKCLEKEPARRFYRTAQELADDLGRYLRRELIRARPCGPLARLTRWTIRRPATAASISLAFITTTLLVVAVVSRRYIAEIDTVNARLKQSNMELHGAVKLATTKEAEADRERAKAIEKEELSRRYNYASSVLLAQQAVELKNTKEAYEILARIRDGDSADWRGLEWDYLWRQIRGERYTFCKAPAVINCIAVDSRGSALAVGTADGQLTIWDVKKRIQLHEHSNGKSIKSICFLEQSQEIAFGDIDGHVGKWRWKSDSAKPERIDPADPVALDLLNSTIAMSPKSKGTWGVLDPQFGMVFSEDIPRVTNTELRPGAKSPQFVNMIEYCPDGRWIATATSGGATGKVTIHDVATKKEITSIATRTRFCLAFSRSGDRVAVGEVGRTGEVSQANSLVQGLDARFASIRVYSLPDASVVASLECGNRIDISSLTFTSDDKELMVAVGSEVKVWNVEESTTPSVSEAPDVNSTLAYDRSGDFLATIHGSPPRIVLRNAITGEPVRSFAGDSGKIYDVAIDPSNTMIAAACEGNAIETWNLATGEPLRRFQADRSCFRVRFDPRGKFIAAGGWSVSVWSLATGELVYQQKDNGWHAGIAFSPQGELFGFTNFKNGVQVVDTSSWEKNWEDKRVATFITLAFSPDGNHLVGCSRDDGIWFWKAGTGEVTRTLIGPSNALDLAFCNDGSRLATGHDSGVTVLWESITGSQLLRLRGPERTGGVVALSSDGRRIATGGGQVIFW
jgi:WD40 repeat protein/tRNA A-37 threonylcarbamoyl transferase component Bud32